MSNPLKNIDIQKTTKSLNTLVSNITGKSVIFNLSTKSDGRIHAESNDLSSFLGLPMFNKLAISTFGSAKYQEKTDDYLFDLHYDYEHLSGGHNGSSFLSVYVAQDGEIKKFNMAGSNREIVSGSGELNRIMSTQLEPQNNEDDSLSLS